MTDNLNFNTLWSKVSTYFTRNDLIIILILAVLAYFTGTYGLNYILPGGPGPGFVHGFLKLPGPGTGIFNVSAFTCLWLVLGLLIIKKPGVALSIAVLIMIFGLAISLALGGHHGNFSSQSGTASNGTTASHTGTTHTNNVSSNGTTTHGSSTAQGSAERTAPASGTSSGSPSGGLPSIRINYLDLIVAIIIEGAGLLALEKKPWRYIFPALLSIMGIITLVLMLTGNAKMGENGAAATVFPLGYVATGILALCLAVILFMYPSWKYIIGAGCAEMFYIAFCWTFNGKSGLFTWAPVAPAIPPLLTFAFVFGAIAAAISYGAILLWKTYAPPGLNKI
jgi:hypothetical protein